MNYSKELILAVNAINTELKDKVVFCGSFALLLHGLLNRPVKDLDIIVSKLPKSSNRYGYADNSGNFDVEGINIKWAYMERYNIKIDVFERKDKVKYTEVVFNGIKIKIEDPAVAIAAKRNYSGKYHDKHEGDLKYIDAQLLKQFTKKR